MNANDPKIIAKFELPSGEGDSYEAQGAVLWENRNKALDGHEYVAHHYIRYGERLEPYWGHYGSIHTAWKAFQDKVERQIIARFGADKEVA